MQSVINAKVFASRKAEKVVKNLFRLFLDVVRNVICPQRRRRRRFLASKFVEVDVTAWNLSVTTWGKCYKTFYLTLKHLTWLESPAGNKHSSL